MSERAGEPGAGRHEAGAMDEPSPVRIDGRSQRAERTRRAIVDALFALLEEGHLRTPAKVIAERAGVSLRALWTNFTDMETLYAAAGRRLLERQRAEYRAVAPDLPLDARIEAFARQRAAMLEMMAPAARAAHLMLPHSPQLQRNRAIQIGCVRDEIRVLFAAELDAAGPDRDLLLNAVLVAATFNAWQMAREQLALDVGEACDLMVRTVTALLAPGPATA